MTSPVVRSSSPWRLVGPYKLSFEPDGSPLFTSTPLVACWRYEPREHLRPLAKTRPLIPPSPLSDRVGYSDHVRFRGYFPVHCIPAYNLPVYASRCPLPVITQDLVRGCRLGFTAVAIPGDMVSCAFKAQPAQIPASPIRALGNNTSNAGQGWRHGHGQENPRRYYQPDLIRRWTLDRGSSATYHRSGGNQPAYQSMINRRFMIVPPALPSGGHAEQLEGQARNFPCLLLETANMRECCDSNTSIPAKACRTVASRARVGSDTIESEH